MIHWLWLIPAAMLGGTISMLVMALFIANAEEDSE